MDTTKVKTTIKSKRRRSSDKGTQQVSKKPKFTRTKQHSIPKDKFLLAFKEINDDIEWSKMYLQRRCSVPIQQISSNNRHNYKSVPYKLLEEARLCTLQRDWDGLAKILAMAKPSNKNAHHLLFQIFVRYAVICLVHNPEKDLLDMFMQGVASCSGKLEKQQFLNSFTNC